MSYLRRGEAFGIRRYRDSDVQAFFEAARESTREVHPWLPWCRPDFSVDDAARWVSSREEAWRVETEKSVVLCDLESDGFVGGAGLNRIDRGHRVANLGYWVRTTWTGRGAATAAIRLCAGYAFEELELERVEIVVVLENEASKRVAEKAGAVFEGMLRKKLRIRDESRDSAMYSLVRGDL